MATERLEPGLLDRTSASSELGEGWRSLTKRATAIALITSPAPFIWFYAVLEWSLGWALAATFFVVIAFRGAIKEGDNTRTIGGPVGKSDAFRLDERVQVIRGVVPHRGDVEALENVQHLEHEKPLRVRRQLVDVVAAVVGRDRPNPI